jgi:hypothetical protein
MHEALDNALAVKTVSAYSTGVSQYVDFCSAHDVPSFPVEEANLCCFCIYTCLFISVAAVLKYISGIRDYQLSIGLPWPILSWYKLKQCLRFLRKKYGYASPGVKRPITVSMVNAFASIADLSRHEDRLFLAASSMAVYSFWRAGEFTSRIGCPHRLLQRHFSWSPGRKSCKVLLGPTKTKLWCMDTTTTTFHTGARISPTACMTQYFNGTPRHLRSPDLPLFVQLDGSAVSLEWMKLKTASFLTALNLDSGSFTGSSWRCGGAVSAREAGISDSVIMSMGRWRSSAYLAYLPVSEENLAEASIRIGAYFV